MSNIIVAFPKIDDARNIRNLLVRHGFSVTAICTSGAQVLSQTDNLSDGLVVCGYRFSDMLYSQLKDDLPKYFDMLLLISPRYMSQCDGNDVVRVTMPLKVHELIDTINMMDHDLTRKRKKRREKPRVRDSKEKETITKAKMLLMECNHMSEEEAHRYVQKRSMDSGNSLVETAEMIISIMG